MLMSSLQCCLTAEARQQARIVEVQMGIKQNFCHGHPDCCVAIICTDYGRLATRTWGCVSDSHVQEVDHDVVARLVGHERQETGRQCLEAGQHSSSNILGEVTGQIAGARGSHLKW